MAQFGAEVEFVAERMRKDKHMLMYFHCGLAIVTMRAKLGGKLASERGLT